MEKNIKPLEKRKASCPFPTEKISILEITQHSIFTLPETIWTAPEKLQYPWKISPPPLHPQKNPNHNWNILIPPPPPENFSTIPLATLNAP